MDLKSVVKYANAAYAGLMIGLAAYFVILIKHGYTFVPSSSISVNQFLQVFTSGTLGLMLGIIPWVVMVMIIATVFIVLINMVYENSLRPRKEERKITRRREERKGKGKK
ncbi:hypothetical protein [Vulcanisaeta sp. JCM 14467]|uniref:hypothetical protein n=1 Tax=Vulcanisaeta sp. JCM 14467 TaxID=1295370 RepID=UPI0006CFF808|nr:hypothetical protein [Vulcanisaeta sp. JCM 14467]